MTLAARTFWYGTMGTHCGHGKSRNPSSSICVILKSSLPPLSETTSSLCRIRRTRLRSWQMSHVTEIKLPKHDGRHNDSPSEKCAGAPKFAAKDCDDRRQRALHEAVAN